MTRSPSPRPSTSQKKGIKSHANQSYHIEAEVAPYRATRSRRTAFVRDARRHQPHVFRSVARTRSARARRALNTVCAEALAGRRGKGGCRAMKHQTVTSTTALFALGQLVATPAALAAICDAGQTPMEFLRRHQSGDWGDLCEADKRENELSIKHDFRILSAYRTATDVKLWIITEADRSTTTILLPEEY